MTFKPFVVLALVATLLSACRPQRDDIQLRFPGQLRLHQLSAEQRRLLRATVEVDGLPGGESRLSLREEGDQLIASGTFTLDIDAAQTSVVTLRLYGRFDAERDEVLLARLQQEIELLPNSDNRPVLDQDFQTDGEPVFDLNRNGHSNLEDLLHDPPVDPTPPEPFIAAAPSTLEFFSGIRLGDFERRVVLVQNQSDRSIDVTAQVFDAPGVLLVKLDRVGSALGQSAKRAFVGAEGFSVPPFSEVIVGVSFAPMNSYLTTGSVLFSAFDAHSEVVQSSQVKIIANSGGELQPPPADYQPSLPVAGTDLGGLGAESLIAFPRDNLFSGLPVTSTTPDSATTTTLGRSGVTVTAPGASEPLAADAAFYFELPAEHRFAATLAGLASDVDLALVYLDASGALDPTQTPLRSSTLGRDPEALEMRNEGDATMRCLLLLGRHDSDEGTRQPNALSADEGVPFSLSAHIVSGPEFAAEEPIAPRRGPLEGGVRVTLHGRGFLSGAAVTFADAHALDVEVSDDGTEIACTLPPGSLDVGRNPATVVVANPSVDQGGDGQAATMPEGFVYSPPAPYLAELRPSKGVVSGGTPVTLSGRFFSNRDGGPLVSFAGVALPATDVTFVSPDELVVRTPMSASGAGGVDVVVENHVPGEGDARSNTKVFTYIQPQGPAPVLTSIAPAAGTVDGNVLVTLHGDHFSTDANVLFGAARALSGSFIDAQTLQALTPAHAVGAVDVVVTNPDGQSAVLDDAYTYEMPSPSVAGVFPNHVSKNGGETVAVDGSGFRSGVLVSFVREQDSYAAAGVTRVSLSRLLVSTPAVGQAGDFDLIVTNPDGQRATYSSVQFLEPAGPAPQIFAISPASVETQSSSLVVITGASFADPVVLVGAEQAAVTEAGADHVAFTTPEIDVAGLVAVRVINADGQSAETSLQVYDRGPDDPAPEVFSLLPSTTYVGVETDFEIAGRFFAAPSVTIGGGLCASLTGSSSLLRCSGMVFTQAGQLTVVVKNGDGQLASTSLSVLPRPGPVITSVEPALVQRDEEAALVINGRWFSDVVVEVDGEQAALASQGPTTVILQPRTFSTAGLVSVRVTNSDGTSATTAITVAQSEGPQITRVSPSRLPLQAETVVDIEGQRFDHPSVYVADVQASVGPWTAEAIAFTAPARQQPGLVPLRVENADGQWTTAFLEYQGADLARIEEVWPDTVPAEVELGSLADGTFSLSVKAPGLGDLVQGAAVVSATLGGLEQAFVTPVVAGPDGLQLSFSAGVTLGEGSYDVVLSVDGVEVRSSGAVLRAVRPRLHQVFPSIAAPGTEILLLGEHFEWSDVVGDVVRFSGGSEPVDVQPVWSSDSLASVVVPPLAYGTWSLCLPRPVVAGEECQGQGADAVAVTVLEGVAEGLPAVSAVLPNPVRGGTRPAELVLLGDRLEQVSEVHVTWSGGEMATSILGRQPGSLSVVTASWLAEQGAQASYGLRLVLADGGDLIPDVSFAVVEPSITYVAMGVSFVPAFQTAKLDVLGLGLDPGHLSEARLVEGETPHLASMLTGADSRLQLETEAGGLPPGLYDLELEYGDGYVLTEPRVFMVVQPEIESGQVLRVPALIDLNRDGASAVELTITGDGLGDWVGRASSATADLVGQEGVFETPEAMGSDQVRLRFTSGVQLDQGSYAVMLTLDGVVVSSQGDLVQAVLPSLQQVFPGRVETGTDVLLIGHDFGSGAEVGDIVLLTSGASAQTAAVTWSGEQQAFLHVPDLAQGSWTLCIPRPQTLSSCDGLSALVLEVFGASAVDPGGSSYSCSASGAGCGPWSDCVDGRCVVGSACTPTFDDALRCWERELDCVEPINNAFARVKSAACDRSQSPCTSIERAALDCEGVDPAAQCARAPGGQPFCTFTCRDDGDCAANERCLGLIDQSYCVPVVEDAMCPGPNSWPAWQQQVYCFPAIDCAQSGADGIVCGEQMVCNGGDCTEAGALDLWTTDLPVRVPEGGSVELGILVLNGADVSAPVSVNGASVQPMFGEAVDFYTGSAWPTFPVAVDTEQPLGLPLLANDSQGYVGPGLLVVDSDDALRPRMLMVLEGSAVPGGAVSMCSLPDFGDTIDDAQFLGRLVGAVSDEVCPGSDVDFYALDAPADREGLLRVSASLVQIEASLSCDSIWPPETGPDVRSIYPGETASFAMPATQVCALQLRSQDQSPADYSFEVIEAPDLYRVEPTSVTRLGSGHGQPVDLYSHSQIDKAQIEFSDPSLFAAEVLPVSPTHLQVVLEADCAGAMDVVEVRACLEPGLACSPWMGIQIKPPSPVIEEVVVQAARDYSCECAPSGWGDGSGCAPNGAFEDAYVAIGNPGLCAIDLVAEDYQLHVVNGSGSLPTPQSIAAPSTWRTSFTSGCDSTFGAGCRAVVHDITDYMPLEPTLTAAIYSMRDGVPVLVDSVTLGSPGVPDGTPFGAYDAVRRSFGAVAGESVRFERAVGDPLAGDSGCRSDWQIVSRGPGTGLHCSLALDSYGTPFIAHQRIGASDSTLALDSYDGYVWSGQDVVTVSGTAPMPMVVAMRSDVPEIAYDDGAASIRRAWQSAGWSTEIVAGVSAAAEADLDFAFDPSGYAHIVYYDDAPGAERIVYLSHDGIDWMPETVISQPGLTRPHVSLAIDSLGTPHLAYYDSAATSLVYAYRPATWSFETVDDAGDVGRYASLALDPSSQPVIAYYDADNGALKLARHATMWMFEFVDSGADDVGTHASLAVDAMGNPHIAYRDESVGDLKYASFDNQVGGWRIELVDGAGDVGLYASLALDMDGRAFIAYYDRGNDSLKLASTP